MKSWILIKSKEFIFFKTNKDSILFDNVIVFFYSWKSSFHWIKSFRAKKKKVPLVTLKNTCVKLRLLSFEYHVGGRKERNSSRSSFRHSTSWMHSFSLVLLPGLLPPNNGFEMGGGGVRQFFPKNSKI